jgi:DNA-binding transcriptional MerR regulator
MRISELAHRARVNIQTVRFYERRGLLREPTRTTSGYRSYEQADLETVVFIRWCQRLGFTLNEVRQLLELHRAIAKLPAARAGRSQRELRAIVAMAREKLADIQERIDALRTMRKQLSTTVKHLRAARRPVCPASRKPRKSSHLRTSASAHT